MKIRRDEQGQFYIQKRIGYMMVIEWLVEGLRKVSGVVPTVFKDERNESKVAVVVKGKGCILWLTQWTTKRSAFIRLTITNQPWVTDEQVISYLKELSLAIFGKEATE